MEMMKKEIMVPKEAHDIIALLAKAFKLGKESLKDGFQPAVDLPVVLLGMVQDIPAALEGAAVAKDEIKAKPMAVVADLASEIDAAI